MLAVIQAFDPIPATVPTVVIYINFIFKFTQGLSRMARTHIHFAPGEPGADSVISGMRRSCQVVIYINIDKAIQGNLVQIWNNTNLNIM